MSTFEAGGHVRVTRTDVMWARTLNEPRPGSEDPYSYAGRHITIGSSRHTERTTQHS